MTRTLYLLYDNISVTPWRAFNTKEDAEIWRNARLDQGQVIREIDFVEDFCREHACFNPCWQGEHKKKNDSQI